MSEYPPGTFGREFQDLAAKVERLRWPFRWIMRRRVQRARQHFEQLRDDSLADWFRRHW